MAERLRHPAAVPRPGRSCLHAALGRQADGLQHALLLAVRFGLVQHRIELGQRPPPTLSKLVPVRAATSSSAERFSMLAPVASLRSFSASMPSIVERTNSEIAETLNAAASVPAGPAPIDLMPSKLRSILSAFCLAMREALSSPASGPARRACRQSTGWRGPSALPCAPSRADCACGSQAEQQVFEVFDANAARRPPAARPVDAAMRWCHQVEGPDGQAIGVIGLRRFFALVLNARLSVQQGRQFCGRGLLLIEEGLDRVGPCPGAASYQSALVAQHLEDDVLRELGLAVAVNLAAARRPSVTPSQPTVCSGHDLQRDAAAEARHLVPAAASGGGVSCRARLRR